MPLIQGRVSDSVLAPQQHSQPSRKGKKAWRKNVDLTEVQQGLAEVNEEVIRGGVIKEKASDDLFAIDIKRDNKASRKLPRKLKTLKADELLAQRSALPVVSMRKRPAGKVTTGVIPAKRQKTGYVSSKELSRLKRIADGEHENTIEISDAKFDAWEEPKELLVQTSSISASKDRRVKAPKTMSQPAISLIASGKKIPAVRKPSGGHSYNPAFADYEKRLEEEGHKAVEMEQARLAAEEETRTKEEARARSGAEADAAAAAADLSEWEEDSEWEGFQSGVDDDLPTKKRQERKTQAQRNRIKRRKEDQRTAKHNADMKKRRAEEQRIKEITGELDERDRQRQSVVLADPMDTDSEADDDRLRRRQLGKYKLPEKDLELVLPDELQESLRLLKPEGNLLKDRYRSMLVRGKVESRRHIPFKKQAKRTFTEKWTHKDFVL